ncbi:MAG: glycosyltransferase family 4 protein, partial [Pirellulaceae bacterium]
LHTHQSRAHVFGLLLRWWTRTPCVATAHSRHWQPHWRWNDHVIANSDATYRYHRHWNLVPAKRMQVVHYLLDVHEFTAPPIETAGELRRQWGVEPDELLAGIIGDVIPRKGHWYAIQAWAEVARKVPASRLVVVGNEKHPRYTRQVKAEAQRLGIADRIIWAGYCNHIPAVMHAIDLCVSAAIEEALGLTVLEAMAAARAVVATDVGGVPENVLPGETGLLVPPGSPSQLAAAMIRLLTDGGYRRACGLAGQRMVRAKFNPEDQLRQTEAIYASLVAARRASRAPAPRPVSRG